MVPCIIQRDNNFLVHEIKILYKETISTFTRDKHVHIKISPISMIKENINIGKQSKMKQSWKIYNSFIDPKKKYTPWNFLANIISFYT